MPRTVPTVVSHATSERSLERHLETFPAHVYDDQVKHLAQSHGWDLASNDPAWKVHEDLHRGVRTVQPIVLEMQPTVTVILSMVESDAEVLRKAMEDAKLGVWQEPAEPAVLLDADDGRHVYRLGATVVRIGSLPEQVEPECIGDTDGDGNCAMTSCPRCGPKRRRD